MITRDELYNMYNIENLTIEDIAKKFGVSGPTISYYKKKFDIPNKGDRNKYNISKRTLQNMYIYQNLRISDISNRLGVCSATISKYLKKYNIPIKNVGHFNKLPRICFSRKQYDFFDGLMLTDGSLTICNSGKRNRNAKISCAFKYKEFSEYINDVLDLGGNIHKKVHKSDRYVNGECTQYGLMSRNNILFTEERCRWYPNGTKVIPNDFRFSPTSMNIAYLSDGSIYDGAASLSLNSFHKDNVINTLGKHLNNIDIKFSIHKNGLLRISKKSTKDFLEFIGRCPIECYKYKWNR